MNEEHKPQPDSRENIHGNAPDLCCCYAVEGDGKLVDPCFHPGLEDSRGRCSFKPGSSGKKSSPKP